MTNTETLDDLGLCAQAQKDVTDPQEIEYLKRECASLTQQVNDLNDARYRARHSLKSAQQKAANVRETLTAAMSEAMDALEMLIHLEHEIDDALDWVRAGQPDNKEGTNQ